MNLRLVRAEMVGSLVEKEKPSNAKNIQLTGEQFERYVEVCLAKVSAAKIPVDSSFWPNLDVDCTGLEISDGVTIDLSKIGPISSSVRMHFSGSIIDFLVVKDQNDASKKNISFVFSYAKKVNVLSFIFVNIDSIGMSSGEFSQIYVRDSQVRSFILGGTTVYKIGVEQSKISIVSLDNSTVNVDATFTNSVFEAFSIKGSTVKNRIRFDGSRFNSGPPNFHDTALPSDVSFSDTVFVERLRQPEDDRNPRPWNAYENDAHLFRVLRMTMRKAGAQKEEGRFFALELRARECECFFRGNYGEWALSRVYGIVSEYGTSVGRSLFSWFAWNCSLGILIWGIIELGYVRIGNWDLGVKPPAVTSQIEVFKGIDVVGLTIQNAVNPLSLLGEKPAVKVTSRPIVTLSLLQSLGSVAIAALLLIALRSRFQKGGGSST